MPPTPSSDKSQPLVLIIDDDAEIRYSLDRVLSSRGYRVLTASSGEEGVQSARQTHPQVIFTDNRMEGMSGLETLQHLRSVCPTSMIILMTAFGTTQTAIEAMKFGAFDYIVKPFNVQRVLELTGNALKAARGLEEPVEEPPVLDAEDFQEGLIGNAETMQEVFKTIGQVAASPVTVLITGESGTGKELVARSVHRHSHLANRPFMAVNCAAIPENLIESELFGHEKGAFTGASQQRIGVFEQCDGGTIFLDEIGDMAAATQTKILRALQNGEIQRVGGSGSVRVKVRLIAATNRELEQLVEEKSFREDLYYRLNVVRIRLPALRERISDVPLLIDFMLRKFGLERGSKVRRISREALDVLMRYDWPGNVRELENVIQRATVIAQGETILTKDLPADLGQRLSTRSPFNEKTLRETASERDLPRNMPSPPAVTSSAGNQDSQVSVLPDALDNIRSEADFPVKTPVASNPRAAPDTALGQPFPMAGGAPLEPAPAACTAEPGLGSINLEEAFDILFERLRAAEDRNILQTIEQAMIVRVLKETGGNQVKASALLGITRATLRKRIDTFNIRY